MPWWGWLIAFGVVVAAATVVTVVVLMTRTMQRLNAETEPGGGISRSKRAPGRRP